ncbi:MAG: MIP family channel protein [Actinomycetota bacterium]
MAEKLLAEFVGTLTLIFIGASSIIAASASPGGAGLVTIALAHGLAIATMVSALGHISGAHFNPAVTIGALVTEKIGAKDAAGYIAAQLAGGAAGAALIRAALPEGVWGAAKLGATLVSPVVSNGQAVLLEAVLTFFLVWVVFATAIDPEGSFGKIAGLTIGFVITMDIMAGGPFTGGAMNPARSFGPALVGGYWSGWWVYWVGPVAGGVIAAVAYDWLILSKRGTGGAATPDDPMPAPHGWGAHGEDRDATIDGEHE